MATATKTKPAGAENEQMDPQTGELVTTQTGSAVTLAEDDYAAYAEDRGAGFEGQTSEDMSVPFLTILQPGSPEVQGEEAVAKAGMIVNRTTGEIISGKEGVTVIPVFTEHMLMEWVPLEKGGGLVGRHTIDSDLARDVRATQPLGAYKHPSGNGNELLETFYVYSIALTEDGSPHPATLAFKSTDIKGYKDWMFRARSIVISNPATGQKLTQLPLFSHAYRLRTAHNSKNNYTWYTAVIGFAGENAAASRLAPSSELYQLAKTLKDAVSSGRLKAAEGTLVRDTGDGSLGPKASADAEKAPY